MLILNRFLNVAYDEFAWDNSLSLSLSLSLPLSLSLSLSLSLDN